MCNHSGSGILPPINPILPSGVRYGCPFASFHRFGIERTFRGSSLNSLSCGCCVALDIARLSAQTPQSRASSKWYLLYAAFSHSGGSRNPRATNSRKVIFEKAHSLGARIFRIYLRPVHNQSGITAIRAF